jgi:protein-disulfide isomerase
MCVRWPGAGAAAMPNHMITLHMPNPRLLKTCLLAALTVIGLAFSAFAAESKSPSTANHDTQLKEYLQKRLRLPNLNDIRLSPPTPGPFKDVVSRTVTVSGDKGESASFTLFTDREGRKLIIGRLIDMKEDPWGRVSMRSVHLNDRPTMGPGNASVTIVEFADFECPYCARAFSQIEALVRNRYPGKVRLVFKNFPLGMHQWAEPAAIAGECIRRQNPDDFWEFARVVYSSQATITPDNLRDRIESFARANSLDGKALDACMMSKSAEAQVKQDQQDGVAIQVPSTPTFFIDGIPVVGLPGEQVFDYVIKSELDRGRVARSSR